jgi:hypothetical protein
VTCQAINIAFENSEVPFDDPGKSVIKEIGHESEVTITTKESKSRLSKWIELYRLQVFWGTMYILVLIAIFAERAYGNYLVRYIRVSAHEIVDG